MLLRIAWLFHRHLTLGVADEGTTGEASFSDDRKSQRSLSACHGWLESDLEPSSRSRDPSIVGCSGQVKRRKDVHAPWNPYFKTESWWILKLIKKKWDSMRQHYVDWLLQRVACIGYLCFQSRTKKAGWMDGRLMKPKTNFPTLCNIIENWFACWIFPSWLAVCNIEQEERCPVAMW